MVTTGSNTANPAGSPKLTPVTRQDAPSDKPEQFENFENLARRLTKVSKSDLDEKRREG